MKFLLKVNPLLLKNQELGIGDLIDAIKTDNPKLYISTGFLDHSRNTIEIVAGKEFQDFIETTFKVQLERSIIVLELVGSKHNSSHKTYMDEVGYIRCGCGWVETFEERRDREVKEQIGDMKVIKMEQL